MRTGIASLGAGVVGLRLEIVGLRPRVLGPESTVEDLGSFSSGAGMRDDG